MPPALTRSDQSVIGKWWWTVDRWTVAAVLLLMAFGILLVQAATPAVAVKHGWGTYYFVQRHLVMLVPAVIIIFLVSLLPPRKILWLAWFLLAIFLPLLIATPFMGEEIKGATRWIKIPGLFSIQPSEFIKPLFAVTAAWLFYRQYEKKNPRALLANLLLFSLIIVCLLAQPDLGMTFLVSATWFGQLFLSGLSLTLIGILAMVGIAGIFISYHFFPHFASRLDSFLTHSGDTYQIDRAIDAFVNGGLFGTGPGAGTVKMSIPDAHADFIFAVAGEELGLIWCLFIIAVFLFIILRSIIRAYGEKNFFVLLAISGLIIGFGLQSVINLASTLSIIPTKGMTLPFISYGGSSLWALALGMGMLLALTRKRYGIDD